VKGLLRKIITLIKKDAQKNKVKIIEEETPFPNLFFLSSDRSKKLVALGIENDAIVGPQFCAYLVNYKGLKWAEDEGFSHKEIIYKLHDEILTRICIDNIAKILSS
tara:strand:+ start:628 stop:945 length:318 start_codon:yes stop_codon:yes gene_type:complete